MATLSDIAEKAGVSAATVSRILNGRGGASPETVQRVRSIAQEEGYLTKSVRAGAISEESDLVVAVLPGLSNPFFGELAASLERGMEDRGLRLLVLTTNDRREHIDHALGTIVGLHAFGAVISSMNMAQGDLERLEGAGIHTVTVDRSAFEHRYSAIVVDQENGFYAGTRHLVEQGCRRIVCLSGPQELELTAARERGYALAIGLVEGAVPRYLYGDLTLEGGRRVLAEFLEGGGVLDGLVCSNDLMAIGAMRALAERGLSIPGDVRVVGNDNLSVDAFLAPALTSISQMGVQVADAVVDELVALRRKETLPRKVILQPQLIIRESSVA